MNEPGIDLTGKLIIKVALGDDIRRILITNEDITYDELVLMMQRVYRGKLNSSDDIVIKYKDEDNDLITIFDSSDLTFAIQCSRILKITLFVNNKPEPLQTDEIKMIKSELKSIRDRCNKLLDKLDDRHVQQDPSSTTEEMKVSPGPAADSPHHPSPSPRNMGHPQASAAGGKEFDPLSTQRSMDDQQNKVMSSFGISGSGGTERAGTPDSISSAGSASGSRQQLPSQPGSGIAPGTPGQPAAGAQPGVQPGMQAPGSGQKIPPWQQQQSPVPSQQGQPQGQGQPGQYPGQAFRPVVMERQDCYQSGFSQNSQAGHPSSNTFKSYRSSLMQSHMYAGHEGHGSPTPEQSGARKSGMPTSQPQGFQPSPSSSFPAGGPAQPQPGYGNPATSQYSGYNQQQPQQPQQQPGQAPAFPQGQQPQQMPYGQSGPQAGPGVPAQAPASQPGQPMPGQQQQPNAGYQQGFPGGQGAPAQPGQMPPPGGNPYARQGPGYTSGYPRPGGSYPQGYQ